MKRSKKGDLTFALYDADVLGSSAVTECFGVGRGQDRVQRTYLLAF